MAYGPQRRHAVSSLTATIQALALMQHLYSPSMFIFIARIVAQVQITAPSFIHPNRSLLALSLMLGSMNAMAVLLHLLDFASGMNNGKSLILDFVANPASLTRVLLLDVGIFILQLTSLVVSYINTHGKSLPKSMSFHTDDLLLPPSDSISGIDMASFKDHDEDEQDDGDIDLESGIRSRSRRRRKNVVYEELSGDMPDIWVDDEDDQSQLLPSIPSRRPGSPLVFSLPFTHLIRLIVLLPAPGYAPRMLGGATPAGTPPTTPGPVEEEQQRPPAHTSLVAALALARIRGSMAGEGGEASNADVERNARDGVGEEQDDDGANDEEGRIGTVRGLGRRGSGRIPGDYWTLGRSGG